MILTVFNAHFEEFLKQNDIISGKLNKNNFIVENDFINLIKLLILTKMLFKCPHCLGSIIILEKDFERLKKLFGKDYTITVYQKDSLVFWSNNNV